MLLYYITGRKAFAGSESEQRAALLCKIGEAARAAVDYVQLREKDLEPQELERMAHAAVNAVRENSSTTKLLINGRTDIALACGADGVHLPAGDLPASEIRALWMKCSRREPVIGASAHSAADVRYAEAHGADFAVLAPIFEKVDSSAKGIGLDALRNACSSLSPPGNVQAFYSGGFAVLALGGVNLTNADACLRAGAAGIAGIRLFQDGNISNAVRRLRQLQGAEGCGEGGQRGLLS